MSFEELNNFIKQTEAFTELDRRFADLMRESGGGDSAELWFAAALASQQTRQKHICVDLSRLRDPNFSFEIFEEEIAIPFPQPETIINALRRAKAVGRPGELHPLILDGNNRLYLYRYWQYEQRLANAILERAQTLDEIDAPKTSAALTHYFDPPKGEVDWQQVAAVVALSKRFGVISGGPGTGKTRTIGIILAMLIEQAEGTAPVIKLAAPTGKAAVRLQESIKKLKQEGKFSEAIQRLIPEEASTLHRLLGYKRHSPYFRHDAGNPLNVDVVVVDEASMVAQPLMAKLMQALPERTRLILLGDHSQLASVEAGSALADICEAGGNVFSDKMGARTQAITGFESGEKSPSADGTLIGDCVVQLQKNYRFAGKGILELSQAVNAGEADRTMEILKDGGHPDLRWHSLNMAELRRTIVKWISDYPTKNLAEKSIPASKSSFDFAQDEATSLHGEPFDIAQDKLRRTMKGSGPGLFGQASIMQPAEVFQQFDQFRILCALRHGPQGVHEINGLVDQFVRRKGNVSRHEAWYVGQPLLITRNDYTIELFNGDVGIILPDPESGGELRAFFPNPAGEYRKIRPFRLPDHELAYAMTVHKSQGSEFTNVLLLLPEQDSPILTRELIYTGITRAAKKVEIWGNEEVFRLAVSQRIKRTSGLRDALRK